MLIFGMIKGCKDPTYVKYVNFNDVPKKEFPKAKRYEPIVFYNVAVYSTIETSFHYFYKVLEFFFLKNGKVIIDTHISDNDEENVKYITKHKDLLEGLLKESIFKQSIEYLVESDFFQEVIEDKALSGYVYNEDKAVEEFAKELYKYRNKVIHSIEQSRRIPSLIDDSAISNSKSIHWWNGAVQEIALLCIEHFCYNGMDIENI